MADNIAITAGAGTTVAADDISSVFYQRVKLSLGADGAATDCLGGAGAAASGVIRVVIASDSPPGTGAYSASATFTPAASSHNAGDCNGAAATITGATQAAQCVLTLASGSAFPPVGSDVSIASVAGMTELNGNTYEVVSVNQGSRLVTIDVDSSGFGAYSSGGVATYVNSMTLRNAFRLDSKQVPALDNITRRLNTNLYNRGVRFLSAFTLTGTTAWSKIYKDAFDTPTPEWDGTIGFSASNTPLRFIVNLT